jgi:hypothetical protein
MTPAPTDWIPTAGRLVYLASPYSHADASVRHARYIYAIRAAAALWRQGWMVYSPIIATHPVAGVLGSEASGFEHWRNFDLAMLSRCDRLTVLRLEGWEQSVGVSAEIAAARGLGLPIDYMDWYEDHGREAGVRRV